MRIDTTFLRSKVARRIFMLFVCCALIPIAVLAVLSFRQVSRELKDQGQKRLQRSAKAVGMGIIERLSFLETEMKITAFNVNPWAEAEDKRPKGPSWRRFKAMALVVQGHSSRLYGEVSLTPVLAEKHLEQIHSGKTVVLVHSDRVAPPRVFMLHAVDSADDPTKGFLLGEVDSAYLFGVGKENTLPPMTELCVLDENKKTIMSSLSGSPSFEQYVGSRTDGVSQRQFEWKRNGTEYLASWWMVFLKSRFAASNWTVVLSQSKSTVLAPMSYFKRVFPLVVLISFWVVLFLSVIQIRRNLVPLEQLKEGTQLISQGLFDMRVHVSSDDEFEELADAFNGMSIQLGRQFRTLKTLAEIDRAILSSLDIGQIVRTMLSRIPPLCSCDSVNIAVVDGKDGHVWRLYDGGSQDQDPSGKALKLSPNELQRLYQNRHCFAINADTPYPTYARPLARQGMQAFLVLPVFVKEQLSGAITLGYKEHPGQGPKDKTRSVADRIHKDMADAPQLRDQVAVAFANAFLVEQLDKLNWGTLTALARTVDAKSSWTAGHSERVTKIAVYIGKRMGLNEEELDTLRRAGLLHDIGKIGVSAAILDKPEKLTDEEFEIIKSHPRLGERILQPIEAYKDVIPMVVQHHEQFGGRGYPDGLAGEDICLGARILAVADVFDALASDRPYREGWTKKKVVDFVENGAGTQFDPKIVDVFLAALRKKKEKPKIPPPLVTSPEKAAVMEQTP